ncbi:MAG: hypothetical protein NT168_18840 [Planctomycetota bacterium]|nr:hypothetical protein [Planctomycetota bacterium]MCY3006696.1 hypothetical protein [Planctomycetota bacterium]
MPIAPLLTVSILALLCPAAAMAQGLVLSGIETIPHQFSSEMRWRKPPEPSLSARTKLFVQNVSEQPIAIDGPLRFDSLTASQLVAANAWAWRDPSWENGFELPAGALRVLRFNGQSSEWGTGSNHTLDYKTLAVDQPAKEPQILFDIDTPEVWIESMGFLSPAESLRPTSVLVTLRNNLEKNLELKSCRLWFPKDNDSYHTLFPYAEKYDVQTWNADQNVPAKELTGLTIATEPLALTSMALEIVLSSDSQPEPIRLWASMKVRPNTFDISGGWTANQVKNRMSMTNEEYLKTLALLHVNTGQIEEVAGFTDNPELYAKYPMKRFNRLGDRQRYDSDAMLPNIHAVEFLGEPQYGGGRPVPAQEVFDKLAPYESWRLPTSVTLSEERTWRFYAGLSDYPHYDAYRVIAPAADAWTKYDRWNGESIRWGAPLETIGSMTRSLREQSRPVSIAYWSQGAHDGWGGILSPRRGSPTPQELRAQAWQGLGNGIMSLYWFNLSIKSLAKFPDLLDPIRRVGREIDLLRPILQSGTAYGYERIVQDAKPSWDLSSIASRDSALLVANDLAYTIDPKTRTFRFENRPASFRFALPTWLQSATSNGGLECFEIDADGPKPIKYRIDQKAIEIEAQAGVNVVGVYVVTRDKSLRQRLAEQATALDQREKALGFDPIGNPEDRKQLESWVD